MNKNLSLTGSYAYGSAMGNTDGLGTFPANPYSMEGEYGPAAIDLRHRMSLSGTINVKWGIRFNPLFTVNTGPPFDITAGRDIYGDPLFNARPGIATDPGKPGVVNTPYGLLDPNPAPGQQLLPRNFGRSPGQIMLNMRVGRTLRSVRAKVARRWRPIPAVCPEDPAAGRADRAAGNRTAHSHWVVRVPAPLRRTAATAWLSRCRFATSQITIIQDRSSATSHRHSSVRPISPPVPGTRFSPRTPITGDWSCR